MELAHHSSASTDFRHASAARTTPARGTCLLHLKEPDEHPSCRSIVYALGCRSLASAERELGTWSSSSARDPARGGKRVHARNAVGRTSSKDMVHGDVYFAHAPVGQPHTHDPGWHNLHRALHESTASGAGTRIKYHSSRDRPSYCRACSQRQASGNAAVHPMAYWSLPAINGWMASTMHCCQLWWCVSALTRSRWICPVGVPERVSVAASDLFATVCATGCLSVLT